MQDANQFLDMSFELGENQLSTLGLIVGFNKSDSTYGWNGYLGGMKRFKIQESRDRKVGPLGLCNPGHLLDFFARFFNH